MQWIKVGYDLELIPNENIKSLKAITISNPYAEARACTFTLTTPL